MGDTRSLPPQPVLVLVHGDGYVEVFGERNVQVHVEHVPAATTKVGERLADEVVDLLLPRKFRELNYPGKLRAASDTRPRLPGDLLDRELHLQLLRQLDTVLPEEKPRRVWRL